MQRISTFARAILAGCLLLAAGCTGRSSTPPATGSTAGSANLLPLPESATISEVPAEKSPAKEHPLEPVLKQAEASLAKFRTEVEDYTCTILRRERIKGRLGEETQMTASIRNRKLADGEIRVPLSVKLVFLHPSKGREVVWVEGANEGKMHVNEPIAFGAKFPVWLKPEGSLAMAECKYPIMDIGIENLLEKLIERGGKDRDRDRPGECEVTTTENVALAHRRCSKIVIKHTVQRPEYDYLYAEVFIDNEWGYPLRYAAYNFPTTEDPDPPVEEEYTYTDVEFNVGLKGKDFEP